MPPPDLTEVARFRRRALADDRALVMAAMGIPYWLLAEEGRLVLYVEARHAAAARAELERYEGERSLRRRPVRTYEPAVKIPLTSLFVFAWLLIGCFVVQQRLPRELLDRGVAVSDAIARGELWRCVTALTLHGDAAHIGANLAAGALFAAFLFPRLGVGLTWSAMVIAGAAGNWLNAISHRTEVHRSIGASTAVFGALGLLVACQLVAQFSAGRRPRLWEVVVPLGAGLALLAVLGVGDERVDFLAHFWGLLAGFAAGLALARVRIVTSMQPSLAAAAVLLPAVAWFVAVRG